VFDLDYIVAEWGLIAIAFTVVAIGYFRRKKFGPPKLAPASPRQRIICGILLVAMGGAWAVYYAGWPLFGGYEKQIAVLIQLMVVIYFLRLSAVLRTA
jgi:hypothetical protein